MIVVEVNVNPGVSGVIKYEAQCPQAAKSGIVRITVCLDMPFIEYQAVYSVEKGRVERPSDLQVLIS
jgi:hypothetical protein